MVPEDELGVLLAKEICAECPVVPACLGAAEQITETYGADFAQGIWGGLTLRERATLAVLGRPVRPCPECTLRCVPVADTTQRCSSCHPSQSILYAEYRPTIEGLLAEGMTYEQVADILRVERKFLVAVCRRWRLRPGVPGRRGKRAAKECGTLAAKVRHQRHGESWENCACRHVPWKKGQPKMQTKT